MRLPSTTGGVAGASVAAGVLLCAREGWARCAAIAVFCVGFCALGFWMLRASPAPIIDVFTWHKVSYAAFANGTNPWSIFMPNIYGQTLWYAPGLADAAQVKVGYPYPPLTFILGGLANAVTGDYRYADVIACTGAGVLLAFCRPGRLGPIAAALFFLTPRSLFVLEQGWTEPLSVLMFAPRRLLRVPISARASLCARVVVRGETVLRDRGSAGAAPVAASAHGAFGRASAVAGCGGCGGGA